MDNGGDFGPNWDAMEAARMRSEIASLREQLQAAVRERDFLQKRFDDIRSSRTELLRLLATPTLTERTEAGVEPGALLKHMENKS